MGWTWGWTWGGHGGGHGVDMGWTWGFSWGFRGDFMDGRGEPVGMVRKGRLYWFRLAIAPTCLANAESVPCSASAEREVGFANAVGWLAYEYFC